MITSGSLSQYQNCVLNITLSLDSPISGFEYSLLNTGVDGSWKSANLVTFSGAEGYLFDQSGNFFGGYSSGVPFGIKVSYDYENSGFSYYHNDVLMANGLDVTGYDVLEDGKINLIMFNKHGSSSSTTIVSGSIS